VHHAYLPTQVGALERRLTLVQADAHARLMLPVAAPTLDRTEWVKDLGLESRFDPVLDRIRYLAENSLTSLMVLHNFLSKHLVAL
jgi:hypothetical protein